MGEQQYLDLLQEILDKGNDRDTRNGMTRSLFGKRIEFDVEKEGFPLLTTKRVFFRGVLEELIWFVNAKTNAKELDEKNVKIWNGNTTREYLDKIGLEKYKEFETGPIYGYQWRHFNAPYEGMNSDYTGKGIDQLQNCIDLIKTDPTSRRILMSGWNPCQLKEMCLPPCHVSYQWYVEDDKLSCMMYQRSGDLFLGVPFNIASTAFLTLMIATLTNKKLGKIIITLGDSHIYHNHFEAVKEQLSRDIRKMPEVKVKLEEKDIEKMKIEDFKFDDFLINNYKPHGKISAPMSV